MSAPCIGFAGLTHLGLVSAAAVAAKGFSVLGFDADAGRVEAIAAGRLPVAEPDLDNIFAVHRDRLAFATETAALGACDMVYISADVPTDASGSSELAGIAALINQVIPELNPAAVLVVLCQVPPGFTRGLALPPERRYYQVETLVLGRAVERSLHPERTIVGCDDPTRPLPAAYAALLEVFACPVLRMRYESAELAKMAINCCLAASVTVANTLAGLAERIGADWGEIAPALRLDSRIGPHAYLAPGLGLGGGNLERDLATVLRLAGETGCEASLIRAVVDSSRHCRDWVLRALHRELLGRRPDAVLGVLGLAYKENTRSTKNSPAIALLGDLHPWPVRVFDPAVPAAAAGHPHAVAAADALAAADGLDALAIMTPRPQFRALDPGALARAMRGRLLVDPYRVLEGRAAAQAGLDYLTRGAPPPRA
ncbi:MAG: nucleotide sugar dehydrogenase, partial [Dongiaceae bacterium]